MAENVQPQSARLVFGKLPSGAYAPISLSSTAAVNINGSITASLGGFNSTLDAVLACSGTSARLQLTGTGTAVVIDNSQNTVNAHVAFGTASVVATTSNQRIPGGDIIAVDSGGAAYVAIILDSSSGNVTISQGAGLLTGVSTPGAGGGGGGNVNITEVGGTAVALGQTTMSASLPVNIASNQSAIPVSINQATPGTTNAVDVTNLPAAVDVNTGNATNDTLRVVLASNQPTVAVSAASLPLPAGAATAANQTAAQGSTGSTAPTSAVLEGELAKLALPTAASDGQMVPAMADKFGRSIVRGAPRELLTTTALSTTGTSGTLLAAQGAGVYADMYRLAIANSSATPVLVTISDGTNSYGFEVPANGTVGFSGAAADATPAASTNTAWTYTVATGTSTIYIHAQFVLNK